MRRETFKFWDLVWLIQEVLRYVPWGWISTLPSGDPYIYRTWMFIITMFADALAPNNEIITISQHSAKHKDIFSSTLRWLSQLWIIFQPANDVIQNGWQDVEESHNTSVLTTNILSIIKDDGHYSSHIFQWLSRKLHLQCFSSEKCCSLALSHQFTFYKNNSAYNSLSMQQP